MLGCPKLTPLQSRFAASAAALALIALIYWSLSSPAFAYAAELAVDGVGASRNTEDHNWNRIEEDRLAEDGIDLDLDIRAPSEIIPIGGNNVPGNHNISQTQTTVWSFSSQLLFGPHTPKGPGLPADVGEGNEWNRRHDELRKRDDIELVDRQQGSGGQSASRQIYVSINTCIQPLWQGTGTQTAAPPQLTLYVSTEASNQNPGPGRGNATQQIIPLFGGFANATVQANDTWYMAVHAPSLPDDFVGVNGVEWTYELAVSIDDYYHQAHTKPNLYLIDSDYQSALMVTDNLTQSDNGSSSYQKWMNLSPPYTIFASPDDHTKTLGLEYSYCGLNLASTIGANQGVANQSSYGIETSMTTRGLGKKPKEQVYFVNLTKTTSYHATLALNGNSTANGKGVVGGGGTVWAPVSFSTKSDNNCALIYNLTLCDQVNYAVPSHPSFKNLSGFYDNYTQHYYNEFNYALQQIPCNTTAAAQYSLAVNCTDCANAYKQWLCAVSIPRCADWSRPESDTWLQRRNMAQQFFNNASYLPESLLTSNFVPMPDAPTLEGSPAFDQTYLSSLATNSSRNPEIDTHIKPGPYKEILPCEDICYDLARSCPAALGFTCPTRGRGLEMGYGRRNPTGNGTITCSYPGAYVSYNGAWRAMGVPSWGSVLLVIVAMGWLGLV